MLAKTLMTPHPLIDISGNVIESSPEMMSMSQAIANSDTPSIDPVTQFAVAVPLMVLYVLGIGLVKLVEKRALGRMPAEDDEEAEPAE